MTRFFDIVRRGAIVSIIAATTLTAGAFSPSQYATSSRLATGKWVKIAIPTNGVYEITQQELTEMGLGDINNVRVYGNGGHMISEVLDGTAIDDLTPVATRVINGKLCFYGKGPVKMSAPTTTNPRFTRTINAYSTHGYYFLTEGGDNVTVSTIDTAQQGTGNNPVTSCYDYFYHEVDRFSFGHSGKDLLGEDITRGASFPFALPQVNNEEITVNISAGGKTTSIGPMTLVATITPTGGATVNIPYNSTAASIAKPSKTYNYYNACSPIAVVNTTALPTTGNIGISFKAGAAGAQIIQANLDNIIITYNRNNIIDGSEDGQMRMAFTSLTSSDMVVLKGATSTTQAWCIDNPNSPVSYQLKEVDEGLAYSPSTTMQASQWVAFDPSQQLLKIASYEEVPNQDIHAMPTPGMVIITNKTFLDQAQRIAHMHKMTDGLDVVVIDQEHIFNEFSSGTPDAMAYRLMCKMFYDRDRSKFKYLLLFGEGSYDNRGLASVKKNRILTYQTDVSNNEDYSYPADDFFGMLDDNSGAKVASAMLRLGVGRFPSSTVAEAKSDVDKLLKYVLNPDYGPWRNNAFYAAETGDSDMHIVQADGINNIMTNNLGMDLESNKVYVDMFPRAVNETAIVKVDDRTSSEARRRLIELLSRGMYYGTYVGHAGYRGLTHSRMWTSTDVNSVTYPQWPIFMSACCDVARYDSDQRGVCEHMFHAPNGGAIALLTSTREVYANSNDQLNQAWTKYLFSWNTTKEIPTLGYAYMMAKQSFGASVSSPNKLKFVLFGDPAMRVAYPRPLFEIYEVNDTPITSDATVSIAPLSKVTVKARVLRESGTAIDTDFTGDATLTIYDKAPLLKNTTYNGKSMSIDHSRDILAQVQGRVDKGEFTGVAVMPRYCRAVNENGMIRVYAHRDDTDLMVNGEWDGLTIGEYRASTGTTDSQPPVVEAMYLNDENTNVVASNCTLYIQATDDLAINSQSLSLGNNMRLLLDGNTSYSLVDKYATVSNEGRQVNIAFPISDLTQGEHSLAYTVHDVAGNATTRTISFIVGNTSDVTLAVEELPATQQATITATSTQDNMPSIDLKVTNALGQLVWSTTTSTFPTTWNLTDASGQPVPTGMYKVWGNYNDGTTHGGTNIASILVVK